MPVLPRVALVALASALLWSGSASAATTVDHLFPSNALTVADASQATGLRVNLAKPDCATHPNDCWDTDVINTLDGFNVQPRISIAFSGPIDPATISSETVFLVGPGGRVGINQTEWEPATNTVYAESDELLDQATTYLLVVTRGVHAANGEPIARSVSPLPTGAPAAYLVRGGGPDVAAASVFTTQSIDAISRKIREQLRGGPIDFVLGANGERTVFPVAGLEAFALSEQNGPTPSAPSPLPLNQLGDVATLAFGTYASPSYETSAGVIPAVGTRTGVPAVQSTQQVQFTLFVPKGEEPAGGWPTTIYGHPYMWSKDLAVWGIANRFARHGIATIAINMVGHGGGPAGSYTAEPTAAPAVALPSGGRGVDQNGDGAFAANEGINATGVQARIGSRDGLRQTTIDLMQLVRELQRGVDVDGDGAPDLSRSRIYYSGQSFGGVYGLQLLGLEHSVRAGVANVPGGPVIELARLGAFRVGVGPGLLFRTPSLYNAFPIPPFTNFNENIPLRGLPIRFVSPDQSAIQVLFDNTEWVQQSANPVAYAPLLSRPVMIQFARGDQTIPNPTTSAIIRAGHLESRTSLYRHDLAYAADPSLGKDPHVFLTSNAYGTQGVDQIATFLLSDGRTIVDPDGAGPMWETPTSMVPDDLAFIP